MPVRLLVTDAAWTEIEPRLAAIKHKAGSPPELSDRLFIEAVLYIARTGIPWRDMPQEFGRWAAVYNRFRRWEARGIWRQLWEHLRHEGCHLAQHLFMDSTVVRASQHAAGARKKRQPSGTGFGPLSGWVFHQTPRRLSRRTDLRCMHADERCPPRRAGL